MEFITSAILGGIVYDSLKSGVYKFSCILRDKLKNYLFKTEELEVIEKIVEANCFNQDTTLEEINRILSGSEEIQKIISNNNLISQQTNNLNNNYGAIVGTNTGEIKIEIKNSHE